MRAACAVALCAITVAGCSRQSPTAPTIPVAPVAVSPLPPASAIARMDVLGDGWIVVGGAPLQMTARIYTRAESPAEFIDDTEHVTWSTDPAGVLTVDRQGRVTAITSGAARVITSLGERSARTPLITAVPDFNGTWGGSYIITGCAGAGDPRTCGRLMFSQTDGSRLSYPFSLNLSQLQDQVTTSSRV
jgi:hypothetical protein